MSNTNDIRFDVSALLAISHLQRPQQHLRFIDTDLDAR
jgi:hypothetical protein